MKKDMDKIVFESRLEIDEVVNALEQAPDKIKTESVKDLINLLDAMYMEW